MDYLWIVYKSWANNKIPKATKVTNQKDIINWPLRGRWYTVSKISADIWTDWFIKFSTIKVSKLQSWPLSFEGSILRHLTMKYLILLFATIGAVYCDFDLVQAMGTLKAGIGPGKAPEIPISLLPLIQTNSLFQTWCQLWTVCSPSMEVLPARTLSEVPNWNFPRTDTATRATAAFQSPLLPVLLAPEREHWKAAHKSWVFKV